MRSELRLEIGPLASWLPHEERTISCYAAEKFPDVFETRECSVKVIKAERTFWEKATILHHEAHRPDGNPQPKRYSRHDYELAKPGTLRLVPKAEVLKTVEVDYRAMGNMIFGDLPEFGEIMTTLQSLQDEINGH